MDILRGMWVSLGRFYLEVLFHEILVQELGFDPYEIGENKGTSDNGNFNKPNDDNRWGGDDNRADENNNNNSDSESKSFFLAVDSNRVKMMILSSMIM